MKKEIQKLIEASISIKELILQDQSVISSIEDLANRSLLALQNDGKIILAGNGGSFGDAQHISAEFTSRFLFDRDALPSIALGTNGSSISAIANDYGYEQVFARELTAIGSKNDVFIPITTSGNSKNIIEAIKVAKEMDIHTVCLTGNDAGMLKGQCESIVVPSSATERIQECHILIGHIICAIVEASYFSDAKKT